MGAVLVVCVECVTKSGLEKKKKKSGLGLRSPDLRMGLFSQQPAACAAFSDRLLTLSAPPTSPLSRRYYLQSDNPGESPLVHA